MRTKLAELKKLLEEAETEMPAIEKGIKAAAVRVRTKLNDVRKKALQLRADLNSIANPK